MDYSMRASKNSRKNTDIDFNISKRNSRRIKSAMKKSSVSWLIALLVLIVGFAGGFFAHKFAFAKDTYSMIGSDFVEIGVQAENQTYTEQGVTCIAFGKDYSQDCTITYYYQEDSSKERVKVDKVDETKAGYYYAEYKTSASKYKSVTLIRTIFVEGVEN